MLKAAVLAVALCLALISTLMADEGGPKSDQELIQGTWKAVSVQLNGRSADAVFVKEHRATFTFRGDAFRIVEATTKERSTQTGGSFTVDAKKSPKQMTLATTNGPLKGHTTIIIFELTGDTLKVGMPAKPNWDGPPERFDQPDVATMVLERIKE